jgi:predicted DNA-binding protein (MmcQ/YjbR family)
MNWGYRLIFVFIAFGGFMGFMVYSCILAPISLVSPEYYKDELNYQQVIDGRGRTDSLSARVKLVQGTKNIQLQLPPEMNLLQPEGSVWFYCVNDVKKDRKFRLTTNEEGIQLFARQDLLKGRYMVKIKWTAVGKDYYTEQAFNIN